MRICLDAGHYGYYNRSNVVKDFYESIFAWKMVNYMKEYFKDYDVSVRTTRSSLNKDVALFTRGTYAKDCDIFISIHANACDTQNVDYPVVIRGLNELKTQGLALELSKFIAKTMNTRQQAQVVTRSKKNTNEEYYGVLRGAKSVKCDYRYIIEHSFYTNKAAAQFLLKDENIRKLAKGEVDIIAKYFNCKRSANYISGKTFLGRIIVEELNVRAKADWSCKPCTIVHYGDVFTIVDEVEAKNGKQKMYKLKSGLYITNSKKYVETFYQ